MEETTSRLRKTFKYPTDGDSEDDLPEALDEEEQETVIHNLHQENEKRNTQYTYILLVLPLTCTIPYLTTLFTPHTTLLSLLSITSLFSTAYLLLTLPPGITALSFLDRFNNPSLSSQKPPKRKDLERLRQLGLVGDGPLATYLPYLNLLLAVLLVALGGVAERRYAVWWGFGWLPAGVQGVVVLAKWIMGGVDPEGELGGLRYEYKGA